MNKQTLILGSILAIFVIAILVMQNKTSRLEANENNPNVNKVAANNQVDNQIPQDKQITITNADKIEIIHFHATQQCWSCIEVGKLALATIDEYFADEKAKGIIVYKDVNGELPENEEIVTKFQARGSSLFINAIKDGQDNIAEDTRVWMLVSDGGSFKKYFSDKLKQILGE